MLRVGIVALSLFLISSPAFAYLDPGTGSMLIQGLFVAIAAVSASLTYYWRIVVKFFTSRKTETEHRSSGATIHKSK